MYNKFWESHKDSYDLLVFLERVKNVIGQLTLICKPVWLFTLYYDFLT